MSPANGEYEPWQKEIRYAIKHWGGDLIRVTRDVDAAADGDGTVRLQDRYMDLYHHLTTLLLAMVSGKSYTKDGEINDDHEYKIDTDTLRQSMYRRGGKVTPYVVEICKNRILELLAVPKAVLGKTLKKGEEGVPVTEVALEDATFLSRKPARVVCTDDEADQDEDGELNLPGETIAGVEAKIERDLAVGRLQKEMARLPAEELAVLRLMMAGKTVRDVEQATGTPKSEVQRLYASAKQRLTDMMRPPP